MANPQDTGQFKVALVGLGSIAEAHLLAYRSLDSIRIVGVVEPRADRLNEIAERYGVRGYATCKALLEDARPDIACILTPVATHRELTEQWASAGVHVLCEKPISVTLEDATAMAKACEKSGVRFFYGSSYRYLPAIQRAKALIQSGAIGEVRLICEHLLGGAGAQAYQPMSAAHYPPGGPGGGGHGLVDHGIHMLDIFPWLCGSVVTIALGRGDRTGEKARTEFALLGMREGGMGILMYDNSTRSTDLPWEGIFSDSRQWVDTRGWVGERGWWDQGANSIRVYGTQGALRIFHYANKLYINQTGNCRELLVSTGTAPDHFGRQLQQFCEDLRQNRPPSVSIDDGIRALRVLHAIYDSERSSQWRTVSDDPK